MSVYIPTLYHFASLQKNIKDILIHDNSSIAFRLLKTTSQNGIVKRLREIFVDFKYLAVVTYCVKYDVLDKEEEYFEELMKKSKTKILDLRSIYNALSCLRYQIEISTIEEMQELSEGEKESLAFLDDFKTYLAHRIVRELPDYQGLTTWEIKK